MTVLRYLWINVLQTALRMVPFSCETGLVRIGNPGRDAPVLLTCNFRLTVERLKRVLRVHDVDAYLLVANSRGVNVWCAATGGLFSDHDVVTVLKTSGIGEQVDHRKVILPQLAATGIEGKNIHKRAGWKVVWGPVRAEDLPGFLANGRKASEAMRRIDFPWPDRFEMAVTWAFPMSLLALLLALPFWREAAFSLVALVWALSLAIFLGFPLYEGLLAADTQRVRNLGFIVFDFGRWGLPLLTWLVFLIGLTGWAALADSLSVDLLLRWGAASLVVVLVLCMDLMGSTPTYKSGLHDDRRLAITLDDERCKGAGFCETVCPKGVFEVDRAGRTASLAQAQECVQCGACLVQCPFDALYFVSPSGALLTPDTVRRYKLNLLGSRLVDRPQAEEGAAPAMRS